jgi:hypothetical protein
MATYFVNNAATFTDGLTWEGAYQSLMALSTALSGNFQGHTIYVADTHNEPGTGAAKVLNTTNPVTLISSDVLTGTSVSYLKGTGDQVYTGDGAYDITIDGGWQIYGIRFVSGRDILTAQGLFENSRLHDCTFKPAAGRSVVLTASARIDMSNPTFDLSADTVGTATGVITGLAIPLIIVGATFSGAGNRTGAVFNTTTVGGQLLASGCDFSGFDNVTTCEIVSGADLSAGLILTNCKTKSNPTRITTDIPRAGSIFMTNVGAASDPTQLLWRDRWGLTQSTTSVHRSGGAVIEAVPFGWSMTTTANASEGLPHYTPWIYGTTTAGTKTFDVYIAHDAKGGGAGSDLTDAECWLEVEVMGTADVGLYTLHTDKRATITTAPDEQDDDASTWTGSPGSNLQKLSCPSVTVGEAGLYRARVAVGKASAGPIYCDPKVTVT